MSLSTRAAPARWDRADIEPRIAAVLDRKLAVRAATARYTARTPAEVSTQLGRLAAAHGLRKAGISALERLAGGASKETFAFTLEHADAPPQRCVLRMDPAMGVVETCRRREGQLLRALAGVLPVAPVVFVDGDGEHLGQPGLVTGLVPGVTRPSSFQGQAVSGVGIDYGTLRPALAEEYITGLVRLHAYDWRQADLSDFAAPAPGTTQAALRQVNWWARVWEQDIVEPLPIITFAERWLRENAPVCDAPVIVHGDYRVGNFLFDEDRAKFTAVLDWELAHIGDFHDDLAWSMQRVFAMRDAQGALLCSGLVTREDFIARYEAASGRRVDALKLRWYEVQNAWKCAVLDVSTACYAARHGLSHQDLVLTWVAMTGILFFDQMAELLREAC